MQITVYGATGTFGAQLVPQLRERGHRVIAAHRGSGVDTVTGQGVAEAADEQLLMFRSAQWFELVDTMTVKAGPLRFVPKMRVQALAVTEAARMMAEAVDARERGTIEVAGPEISDFAEIARRLAMARARRDGTRRSRVVGIPLPGPMARDGLIPPSPRMSDKTVDEWLRSV